MEVIGGGAYLPAEDELSTEQIEIGADCFAGPVNVFSYVGMQAIDERIEAFLAYQKHERNAAVGTLKAYKRTLGKLSRFCHDQGVTDLNELEGDLFHQLLEQLKLSNAGKALGDASISLHYHVLSSFFAFITDNYDDLKHNPMRRVRIPKQQHIASYVPTGDDISKLIAVCAETEDTFIAARDQLMVSMLYDTGMRVSELCNITLSDLNIKDMTIKVMGKGHKLREVLFTKSTLRYMGAYIKACEKLNLKDSHLFLKASDQKLEGYDVAYRLQVLAERAELPHLHPHTIRHAFATHLIESGANLAFVQQLLGHADPKTTMIYVQQSHKAVRCAYDQYHHEAVNKVQFTVLNSSEQAV